METPPSLPADFTPDVTTARRIVKEAVSEDRTWLNPMEVCGLMAAYSIPITPALFARDADEAVAAAAPWLAQGQTVVAKILSPDIVHKSEVGGVRLNLTDEDAVREAVAEILDAGANPAAAGADSGSHHPSDDTSAEGARADRRHRRRSDIRSGRRLRMRRDRSGGHQRQGAGAAATRSQTSASSSFPARGFRTFSRPTATCRRPTKRPSRWCW